MSDFDTRLDGLLKVGEQNSFAITGLQQQMGILAPAVQKLQIEMREEAEWRTGFEKRYEEDQQRQKERERIESDELNELRICIENRVATIFRENNIQDNKLFGVFMRKAWIDGKRHSRVKGKAGMDTRKMDFEEVKEFYSKWTPYAYGVEGYIKYLNSLNAQ